ncbi:hypothetical protein [Persephonella sp.]|nr:hypothetical protein [Aquificota bacterium]
MKDLIRFLIGFIVGFAAVYRFLSRKEEKQKNEETIIEEPPQFNPYESSGKLLEVLKRFNEMKQKI